MNVKIYVVWVMVISFISYTHLQFYTLLDAIIIIQFQLTRIIVTIIVTLIYIAFSLFSNREGCYGFEFLRETSC